MTEELKEQIISFITNGKIDEKLEIPRLAMQDYEYLLQDEFGLEREESEYGDTNGWSVDFTYYFSADDLKVCISGSLWYNAFYSISIEKPEVE